MASRELKLKIINQGHQGQLTALGDRTDWDCWSAGQPLAQPSQPILPFVVGLGKCGQSDLDPRSRTVF